MPTKGNSVVEKDLALVLKAVPYKEADLILSLFTRSRGLQTVRAYGARSLKSKVRAACQPFSLAEFEFYTRGDRYWVKEASIRSSFAGLQTDYARYSTGCLILELTEKVLRYADEFEDLFVLVVATLTALDQRCAPPENLLLFFLLRLIHLLGIFPVLRTCSICGQRVDPLLYWSGAQGGAVCSVCARTHAVETGHASSATLVGTFGRGQISELASVSVPKEDILDAINLMLAYLRDQFQIHLRTRRSLRL